jgi:hypothetical protein
MLVRSLRDSLRFKLLRRRSITRGATKLLRSITRATIAPDLITLRAAVIIQRAAVVILDRRAAAYLDLEAVAIPKRIAAALHVDVRIAATLAMRLHSMMNSRLALSSEALVKMMDSVAKRNAASLRVARAAAPATLEVAAHAAADLQDTLALREGLDQAGDHPDLARHQRLIKSPVTKNLSLAIRSPSLVTRSPSLATRSPSLATRRRDHARNQRRVTKREDSPRDLHDHIEEVSIRINSSNCEHLL